MPLAPARFLDPVRHIKRLRIEIVALSIEIQLPKTNRT